MVEMHGWITIRETYEVTDEDNLNAIVDEVNSELEKLKYINPKVKWMNGEGYLQFALFTNHWSGDCQELVSVYYLIAKKAVGSYGLLYVHDDESKDDCNSFVVYKLARGKVERITDTLLSPFIPTVEDSI